MVLIFIESSAAVVLISGYVAQCVADLQAALRMLWCPAKQSANINDDHLAHATAFRHHNQTCKEIGSKQLHVRLLQIMSLSDCEFVL